MKNTLVFTGSYTQPLQLGTGQIVEGKGEGISVFRMDECGGLTPLSNESCPNPTYIALDKNKRRLYTVNELKEYEGAASSAVSAYTLNTGTGELRLINRRATGGEDACNITISPNGSHLLTANFTGGSLCVFPIDDNGVIGRPSCFFQHTGKGVVPDRQDGPHVHQVISDIEGKYVLVPDLGTDEIAVYGADWSKGHLCPTNNPIQTKAGAGPRLCAFDKTGKRLYLLAELGNTVSVYDYDCKTGSARLLQSLSTLPDGFGGENTAACIKLHRNGKLLYASNRGHDSIAAYHIAENGLIELSCIQKTDGRTPRDFDIDPSGSFLIVGNQESDELVVFGIDEQNGSLSEILRRKCPSVTAVVIAEMELD